ncbi:MAG: class I SAM-dependent DNA methyltransferase [Alphaproteobacteria bacterium]|nr:class I SAM-dependent DNA methyltransferase [Alphaproteobacteria bacterium]
MPAPTPDSLEAFINRWQGQEGGQERANFPLFLSELCDALALPRPNPASATNETNDYVFERRVDEAQLGGTTTPRRIDLYKRGAFILEAKQSRQPGGKKALPDQLALPALPEPTRRGRATAARAWDVLMFNARRQAQDYARLLPSDHPSPPFLLILDVGHVIELYADFTGQGRNYAQFPDNRSHRIFLEDLRRPEIQTLLQTIWTNPQSLDPARKVAAATREIAERLAHVSRALETAGHPAETAAMFLMRCLFTMFAEDVGLLPEKSFRDLLARCIANPANFQPMVRQLWEAMDTGGFAYGIETQVRRFNGEFFKDRTVLPLARAEIGELHQAASRNWKDVEPSIFGTLLEQALNPAERRRLGAHYTPRAYVERLVVATVMEPLRADWSHVLAAATRQKSEGRAAEAIATIRAFHEKLCATRILDPACGTGNFLYVALELLKRLEAEVVDALADLGGQNVLIGLEGLTVDPHQFRGIELNPRAATIAELVLWIGYLQWHLRSRGGLPADPVLRAFRNIEVRDAVLEADLYRPTPPATPTPTVIANAVKQSSPSSLRAQAMKARALPSTRQEPAAPGPASLSSLPPFTGGAGGGYSTTAATTPQVDIVATNPPYTGNAAPPPTPALPVTEYANPRRPKWPDAEFIVGNPPFIGSKFIRERLGDAYAEALWAAHPAMNDSADFVMYWWDHAALLLTAKKTRLRRFGFVTTNSITQVFQRRTIARYLEAKAPLSLAMAIPDHPWTKATPDAAAVRIAMTVAEAARGGGWGGRNNGILQHVTTEVGLDTDTPQIAFATRTGPINADLTVGADLTAARPLKANEGVCSPGVKLHGAGFIVTPAQAEHLGLGRRPGLEQHIRTYRNGRDITGHPRNAMVIDLLGLDEGEVRERFPEVYQYLLQTVRQERILNSRATYRDNWWLFGEPRRELRPALRHQIRYIATTETSKHRVFQFVDSEILPDNMIVVIAAEDAYVLGAMQSSAYMAWFAQASGTLEDRPRFTKSRCFDPFPFPATDDLQKARIRRIAEDLDAHRKRVLAEHPHLTLTGLYNVLEKLRAGIAPDALPAADHRIFTDGLVLILKELHDRLDAAVAAAYGWPVDLPEQEILTRLVALNRERAAEEAAGHIRWLRPEYQIPRFGSAADKLDLRGGKSAALPAAETAAKPAYPASKPPSPPSPASATSPPRMAATSPSAAPPEPRPGPPRSRITQSRNVITHHRQTTIFTRAG